MYQRILQTLLPLEQLYIPFSYDLCSPITRSAITLLSQILGSNTISEANEAMVGIFLYSDRPGTVPLRFDEYFAKEICFQLSKFEEFEKNI